MATVWGLLRPVATVMAAGPIPQRALPTLPQPNDEHAEANDLDFHFIKSQGEILGIGAQGKVTAEYDEQWGLVACKTIRFRPGSKRWKDAERECEILKRLSHKNIVKYLHSKITQRSPIEYEMKLYMEYCEPETLKDAIERQKLENRSIEENHVWNIILQITDALKYCHYGPDGAAGPSSAWPVILHRDIKPGNILFSSHSPHALDSVKLADFGLSLAIHGNFEPASYVGTRIYTAPEINSEAETIRWTRECDFYSFGLTMHEVCASAKSFSYHRTSSKQDIPALPTQYSEALKDFIFRCMSFDITERPPTTQLHKIAEHEIELRNPVRIYSKYLRDMIGKSVGPWITLKYSDHSLIGLIRPRKEGKDALISLLICNENIRFYSRAIPKGTAAEESDSNEQERVYLRRKLKLLGTTDIPELVDLNQFNGTLDEISEWRTQPHFHDIELLGKDSAEKIRKYARTVQSWRIILTKALPKEALRRYVAKQRWRLLLQSIHIMQRSKSYDILAQPFPELFPRWYPTESSAKRSLQDIIRRHQVSTEELPLMPCVPSSLWSMPVYERPWDTSHPLNEDHLKQFGGLDLHTSAYPTDEDLHRYLGDFENLGLHTSDVVLRGSFIHPSYEDFQKDFRGSDSHTSVAASQGSVSST